MIPNSGSAACRFKSQSSETGAGEKESGSFRGRQIALLKTIPPLRWAEDSTGTERESSTREQGRGLGVFYVWVSTIYSDDISKVVKQRAGLTIQGQRVSWSCNIRLLESASFELAPGTLTPTCCLSTGYILVNDSSVTKPLLTETILKEWRGGLQLCILKVGLYFSCWNICLMLLELY